MSNVSQLLESRRSRIGRWVGAALIVSALHAGAAALSMMQWPEEEFDEEAAGAVTVELAPLPAPTPVDTPDVAHGPQVQQETTPTPEASREVVKEVQEDIPPVEPSPAPEPEVALPKPQPEEKEPEQEEEAPEAVAEKQPQQEAAEAMTTAPPRVEAEPAASSAPAKGASPAAVARAQASWQTALMRQLNRHKRVPRGARRRRGQWQTVVAFTIDRDGEVVASRITKSSGVRILDEEALALLQRVKFPPPPDLLPGLTFEYSLPIKFGVN